MTVMIANTPDTYLEAYRAQVPQQDRPALGTIAETMALAQWVIQQAEEDSPPRYE